MKMLCKPDPTISLQYHRKQEFDNWFHCCMGRHKINKQSENWFQPNIPWSMGEGK